MPSAPWLPGEPTHDHQPQWRQPRRISRITSNGRGGLFALCGDGSCWEYERHAGWFPLPAIPHGQTMEAGL